MIGKSRDVRTELPVRAFPVVHAAFYRNEHYYTVGEDGHEFTETSRHIAVYVGDSDRPAWHERNDYDGAPFREHQSQEVPRLVVQLERLRATLDQGAVRWEAIPPANWNAANRVRNAALERLTELGYVWIPSDLWEQYRKVGGGAAAFWLPGDREEESDGMDR